LAFEISVLFSALKLGLAMPMTGNLFLPGHQNMRIYKKKILSFIACFAFMQPIAAKWCGLSCVHYSTLIPAKLDGPIEMPFDGRLV